MNIKSRGECHGPKQLRLPDKSHAKNRVGYLYEFLHNFHRPDMIYND